MKKYMRVVLLLMVMLLPARAAAAVRFSEIAWMGIAGDNGQYGEWLELYNDGDAAVDLSGWKIYGDGGGQILFTLSKSIPSGGYFLVERTTASMPDPVPNIDDEHGTFGGGGLSNAGEDIVMKDAAGVVVQALNYESGWPAGDATTKQTMQWNGTSWITAAATPKSQTVGSMPVDNTGTDTETDLPADTDSTADTDAHPDSTKKVVKTPIKKKPQTFDPHIELTLPRILDAHVPYQFAADVYTEKDINPAQGVYRWNFGDGAAVESFKRHSSVSHTYQYPGTYTLWFGYYASELDADPILSVSSQVAVQLPDLALAVVDGEALQIQNKSSIPVDLSKWSVLSNGFRSVIPAMTILGPHATAVIPQSVLRIPLSAGVQLIMPDGKSAHSTDVTGEVLAAETIAVDPDQSVRTDSAAAVLQPEAPVEPLQPMQSWEPASPQKTNSAGTRMFGAAAITIVALCVVIAILLERAVGKP